MTTFNLSFGDTSLLSCYYAQTYKNTRAIDFVLFLFYWFQSDKFGLQT